MNGTCDRSTQVPTIVRTRRKANHNRIVILPVTSKSGFGPVHLLSRGRKIASTVAEVLTRMSDKYDAGDSYSENWGVARFAEPDGDR